jgi:sugar-specific transcriptional regulator TrmB
MTEKERKEREEIARVLLTNMSAWSWDVISQFKIEEKEKNIIIEALNIYLTSIQKATGQSKAMDLKDTIEAMISDDYKERFKAEYKQLTIRIDKLAAIISNAKTNSLDFKLSSSIDTLEAQLKHMLSYACVLRERAATEGINLD